MSVLDYNVESRILLRTLMSICLRRHTIICNVKFIKISICANKFVVMFAVAEVHTSDDVTNKQGAPSK